MDFFDPKKLEPDVYKFVNIRGEYRFFDPRWKHRDAVQPGENAWEAGMISVLPDGKSFSVLEDSSETLHIYGVNVENLGKALGRAEWESPIKPAMTSEEVEKVLADIDEEGMWYAFDSYSEYREITDAKFHDLRRAFVKAGNALNDYLASKKKERKHA